MNNHSVGCGERPGRDQVIQTELFSDFKTVSSVKSLSLLHSSLTRINLLRNTIEFLWITIELLAKQSGPGPVKVPGGRRCKVTRTSVE